MSDSKPTSRAGSASGDVAPGDVAPGDVASGDVAPGDVAPGDVAPGSCAPGDVASSFTLELIDEITRDRFRPHAWLRLLSRSWHRSIEDIRASRPRARSMVLWAAAALAIGLFIVLSAWWFHPGGAATPAMFVWLPWYACSVVFVGTHLGMAESAAGEPHHKLLLPNGLTFLRLALAPLVVFPCLSLPAHPITGPIFALFLIALSLTDVLDGWLARRRNHCTRLGRMLDHLADVALVTCLAVGLYRVGAIPPSLMWLLVVRYPLVLIGAVVLYFAKGPASLGPTSIGRVTTLAVSVWLLATAALRLVHLPLHSLAPSEASWSEWSLRGLQLLLVMNILYIGYRGIVWKAPAAE